METMASMLIRVARDASVARNAARVAAAAASRPEAAATASRAARSAAAAASRAARSAAAAASLAARSGVCVTCFPLSGPPRSKYCDDAPRRCTMPDYPVAGLDVTDKDLESDEAIWVLYERWCKAYNKERDPDEMARRFHIFKRTAEYTHDFETSQQLGPSSDGFEKQDEKGIQVINPWAWDDECLDGRTVRQLLQQVACASMKM
uniref:Cathepsin propeptide inhibitor domain-containing protein n=1 Tax=Arundo donax TaxID=35708 RepID=A0A0A9D7R1_ARUDO